MDDSKFRPQGLNLREEDRDDVSMENNTNFNPNPRKKSSRDYDGLTYIQSEKQNINLVGRGGLVVS